MQQNFDPARKYGYTELSNIAADLKNRISTHLLSNTPQQGNLTTNLVLKFVEDFFLNKHPFDLKIFGKKQLIHRLNFAQKHFLNVGKIDPDSRFLVYQAIALLSSSMTDLWNKKKLSKKDENIFSKYLKSEDDNYPIFDKLCKKYKIDKNKFFS